MKLLVDMNLSPRWVKMLADAGIEAVNWSSIGTANAPDTETMAYAGANDYVVLTHDLDFSAILLTKAGCRRIFDDKIGGSRGERPGLAKVMAILREDDALVVWKLDRLGRSVKNLVDLVTFCMRKEYSSKASPTQSTQARPLAASFSMLWPVWSRWNES